MRFDFTAESQGIDPESYEPFYNECQSFFDDILNSGRWKIWVADIDGVIVSHVFVEIIDTVPRPERRKSPFGFMTNVYTLPGYRSMGIGGMILEEVHAWAKELGLTFLMVWPSELSVEFYARHGFKQAKEVMENHLKTN